MDVGASNSWTPLLLFFGRQERGETPLISYGRKRGGAPLRWGIGFLFNVKKSGCGEINYHMGWLGLGLVLFQIGFKIFIKFQLILGSNPVRI